MCTVAFSLAPNINQSAYTTLDWVMISQSNFDLIASKLPLEFLTNRKITPYPMSHSPTHPFGAPIHSSVLRLQYAPLEYVPSAGNIKPSKQL